MIEICEEEFIAGDISSWLLFSAVNEDDEYYDGEISEQLYAQMLGWA